MNRRTMLLAGAAALSASALPTASKSAPIRRVRPGEPGWPSQAAWDNLNRAVGGSLIKPEPLLGPCANESSAACADVLKHLQNPMFIGDQPSGTQVSGWFRAWEPEPSAYVVRARHAGDVAAAVKFAQEHRLRVAVKGGAHSYQGTSTAGGSLLVWTRAMNAVELHDAFVPAGCAMAPVPAVSVGAGAMWIDAYDAVTTKAGRYVQGGGCTSVGVAGLVQSGGFGSSSKGFGMAAANLLEAEVVTADGSIRIANDAADASNASAASVFRRGGWHDQGGKRRGVQAADRPFLRSLCDPSLQSALGRTSCVQTQQRT
jgi:FAD binding domain